MDRSYVHQSSAIPGMPGPMEMPFVITREHLRANVSGIEMYRVPLFHRLIDDGHRITFLANRDVMPSPEFDADLQRLKAMRPDLEPFIRDRDPMLDAEFWDVRSQMNLDIQDTYYEEKKDGSDSTDWFLPRFHARQWGEPPDADVVWLSTMRTNVASGLNQSYITGCYLDRGVPVILHDSNRQMSGTAALIQHMGYSWPHPLLTIVSPYLEPTSWGPTELLDFPYMARFEQPSLPVAEKQGIVYVGNDYNRRDKMAKLLLKLPEFDSIPVRVYGRFENNKKDESKLSDYKGNVVEWKNGFPDVEWMGSIPNAHVPAVTNSAILTVNIVKLDYEKLGLATLRTFESPLYGTLQVADRDIHAIDRYVPDDYLVASRRDVRKVYKRVREMDDATYAAELERQRDMVRKNDFDSYFYPRFMEILDDCCVRAWSWNQDGAKKLDANSPYLQPARSR